MPGLAFTSSAWTATKSLYRRQRSQMNDPVGRIKLLNRITTYVSVPKNTNMPIYAFFAALFLLASCAVSDKRPTNQPEQPQTDTVRAAHYTNPVFEPILADPSVVRDPKTGDF